MSLVGVFLGVSVGLRPFLILDAEERARRSVNIGDTERKLITVLRSYRIVYNTEVDGDQITYSHGDGFLGMYFYVVANGRVEEILSD
jgi:hypothetical protein